jgi:3-deoxy-D-manno-octulosonate 8-phosphate phosphatase (KDO 8-P phosphatase)
MMFLEQNIKGFCAKFGVDFVGLLQDFDVENVVELSIVDLESIAEEYETDIQTLMFSPLFENQWIQSKLKHIKVLILDVDGVMTDAGMYYTENGDQIKKFNAKDGMAILHLKDSGVEVGIISSGFYGNSIHKRAEILKIERCYVGREPKLQILEQWCSEMKIDLKQVAMIGDDVNDLEVFSKIGFRACPSDAVQEVKREADLILTKKGGQGCIREFVDNYLKRN